MYLDPWSYLTPWSSWSRSYYYEGDEPSTWYEHFAKGFASMGVLGFLKVLLASPSHTLGLEAAEVERPAGTGMSRSAGSLS